MKLIPNWRKAWKLHSVWLSGLFATAAGAWIALPDEQQKAVLAFLHISPGVAVVIGFVAVIVVRLKAQPPKDPPQ